MAEELAVNTGARMPGYWHFVWMLFMQPLGLLEQLNALGIARSDIVGCHWWWQRNQPDPRYMSYRLRLVYMLVMWPIVAFLFAMIISGIFPTIIFSTNVFYELLSLSVFCLVIGFMFGVVGGAIAGTIVGLAIGIAAGVIFGALFCLFVAYSDFGGSIDFFVANIVFGGVLRLMIGMVQSVATPIRSSVGWHLIAFLFNAVLCFVLWLVLRYTIDWSNIFWGSAMAWIGYSVIYFRLPCYFIEILWQYATANIRKHFEMPPVYMPILFHELSYFPYIGLTQRIINDAELFPILTMRVIHAAQYSPGQKRSACVALAKLQATELHQHVRTGCFYSIAEKKGLWLPIKESPSLLLGAFCDAARFMQAGLGAVSSYVGLQHLSACALQLQQIDNQLLITKDPIARFLPPVLQTWREVLNVAHTQALEKAKNLLPNPFIAGTPLSPDMSWGQAVFRGRAALIQQVETLLADQQNTTSIALIGPRRCGKSSLLNMLRVMLPDTIVVLFDLQSNPVDTPTAFYQALAHTAREQAQRSHRLQLPELVFTTQNGQQKSPIEALKHWLDQLEQFSTRNQSQHRILICIDEFERLETLFPDQNRELLQLMGLFRATIQHGRRVRLLVAGAAPFDELGTLWNDHFINLREMRVGFLDEETVVQLLTKPIDEFPPSAISAELAHEIYRRSRGQPFLTQVYGYALVETLNRSKRKIATLDDIEQIEPELLSSYTYYFRGIWQEVPPEGQVALTALAHGEPITLARETKRWLRRRMLVDDQGQLLVPLFGRWIREKDEMV